MFADRFRPPAPMTAWVLGLATSLILPALPRTADATTVRALSLREKTEVSKVVVYGVVERVETSWREVGAFAQTLITVKVIEGLKGGHEPGERVIVYRGGGTIGDFVQTAPGLSQYEPGEEVVLFLEPLGAQYVGIGIGIAKYAVADSQGEKIVTHAPKVSGVTFRAGQPPVIEPILPMAPTSLSAFLKEVRAYVNKAPTRPVVTPKKGAHLKPKLSLPTQGAR